MFYIFILHLFRMLNTIFLVDSFFLQVSSLVEIPIEKQIILLSFIATITCTPYSLSEQLRYAKYELQNF